MKRGLSLITSLMMTASVFGGAASQALNYSNVAIVSAAAAQPVMNIGDPANGGTTRVPFGTKTVKIPVYISATDLNTVVVDLEVTADKAGAANPQIAGVTAEVENVSVEEAVSNTRRFVWSADGLSAPELNKTIVAKIEVALPADAKEDSTYTLTVKGIDASDPNRTEGYAVDAKSSDLAEKIAFGAEVTDSYTLSFGEKKDSKWAAADKITVKAGDTVPVGLLVKSTEYAIGSVVLDYAVTEGAAIKGFEDGDAADEGDMTVGENKPNSVVWVSSDSVKGSDFSSETNLYTVNVTIPADAKAGAVYTLSAVSLDTSTNDRKFIAPSKLPTVDLVVKGEEADPVKKTIELEIGTVTVPYDAETAEVPVLVKNGDANTIVAMFEAKFGAAITKITEAELPGTVSVGEKDGSRIVWSNEFKVDLEDYTFGAEGEKLVTLTIALPKEKTVSKYPVEFVESEVDISDGVRNSVKPLLTNGAVIIEQPEITEAETTPAATAAVTEAETTPAATAAETTPAATEAQTTPAATAPVTTPAVTAAETTPAVTTEDFDPIDLPEGIDPVMPAPGFDGKIKPVKCTPDFYYEHEDKFYKLDDELTAELELFRNIPVSKDVDEKGYKTETVKVEIKKENLVFPKEATPNKVYDGKTFIYNVPFTLDVANFKADKDVMDFISTHDIVVEVPAYIGQLGDIDLNHKINQVDGTYMLREILSLDVSKTSFINTDKVLGINESAKSELGDRMYEFALFLADTTMDGTFKQADATFVLKAVLARDVQGIGAKDRIDRSIWEKLGILK